LVKNGHRKYKEAIKLVFSGGGPTGFSDKALRRLEREATILGRLNNPHIVRLRSFGVSASREVFWLIMEHLDGSSLDVTMQDGDIAFTEEGTVRLALQMLTALNGLHKMGVVHRDVKPQNIVECADSYKLIDVGAAAVVEVRAEEVGQSLVTQGTVLNFAGTHGFMPPEAYRDPTQVGPHSDLFALAATVFYLLSRQMPFQAENEFGWMFAVAGNMEEQAPRLADVCPGVSSGLSDIIAKGLHKKISERYTSAMEMKSDLEELMQSRYSDLSLPSNWKDMSSPWQDVERVVLSEGKEKEAVIAAFRETMPANQDVLVGNVERVQNATLWNQYAAKRRTMMQRQGATDRYERRWLFHGTGQDTVVKILTQGFNRNFGFKEVNKNALTLYGKGVYFAVNASYSSSHRYSKPSSAGDQQMFACRVLVGEYCQGKQDQPTPDVRHGTDLYDSTVDNVNTPQIFVAYHDAQAYPEYLITFKAL